MALGAAGVENRGKEGLALTGDSQKQAAAGQTVTTKDLIKNLTDDSVFLKVGDDAVAVIKATDVMVGK